jgi:hypothetical protein
MQEKYTPSIFILIYVIILLIMKKILILFIFTFLTHLESLPFKEIFINGDPGDYSIYQNGKSLTLLHIHSKNLPFLTLEEITFPKNIYENIKGEKLNDWILKGALGSTSWTLMEINTHTLEITSTYCFSKNAHLDLKKEDTLIASLLNLSVKKLPKENLLRVGPKGGTKNDTRDIWMPTMNRYGLKATAKKMDVYEGVWDKDSSPLSGKEINLYMFDDFPFPFWIKIQGNLGSKKMICMDSGKKLSSLVKSIPKMAPSFLSGLEKWSGEENKFSFLLKADRSVNSYTIYLLEVCKNSPSLIPVDISFQKIDGNVIKFDIEKQALSNRLTSGKKYRLYVSYEQDKQIKSIMSNDIIHWK